MKKKKKLSQNKPHLMRRWIYTLLMQSRPCGTSLAFCNIFTVGLRQINVPFDATKKDVEKILKKEYSGTSYYADDLLEGGIIIS